MLLTVVRRQYTFLCFVSLASEMHSAFCSRYIRFTVRYYIATVYVSIVATYIHVSSLRNYSNRILCSTGYGIISRSRARGVSSLVV
eukprot:COSAG02_NODE_37122_length_446_cov_0.775216_2_plen_85_part_01